MAQSAEQLQAARELAAEYGLTGADFYQHKQSKSFLISRTGIEKIQYKAGIEVGFDAEKIELDFAAVKATASRKVKAEGKTTATKLTIQTFGSASKANCQVTYYLEMAEKRALSRAVLKLTDFYQLGVYGEDEMPPVSFRADEAPASAPAVAESPAKPAAGNAPAATASTSPAPSTTSDQSIAGPVEIPAVVLGKLTRQFEAVPSGIELKKLWESLTKNEATALFDVKEAAKARLAAAAKLAQAEAARQAAGTMRVAGDDTSLVDEFEAQPVVPGRGPAVEYATGEQRQTIMRLLDHPTITRKEKTKLLLYINKLDKERARQALLKLREAIGEREGIDPRDGSRAQLKNLVTREGSKLTTDHADRLLALAADPEATLEALVDALTDAQNVLIDDETYGTDEELAAADADTQLAA
jgi:hypothetical protein